MILHQIKLSGKIEFDLDGDKIDPEKEYALMIDRIQNKDGLTTKRQDDDKTTYTYTFVPLGTAVLTEGNKAYKGKSKSSTPSQVLRMRIEDLYDAKYAGTVDREVFYQQKIANFISIIEAELA
jgi:hypothetical protein